MNTVIPPLTCLALICTLATQLFAQNPLGDAQVKPAEIVADQIKNPVPVAKPVPDANPALPAVAANGKNLFGENIDPTLRKTQSDSSSQLQKTVAALIKATQNLSAHSLNIHTTLRTNQKQLQDYQAELTQLGPLKQKLFQEWQQISQKCQRMGDANILSFPENDPNVQLFRQLRVQQRKLEAQITLIEEKTHSLPGQINTLQIEIRKYPSYQADLNRRIASLLNSWEAPKHA